MPSSDTSSGHRKRLRERFIKGGLASFHDYEIVELLLTLGSPRKDCKHQAKEAIKRFKTLRGVLEAPPEELQQIEGIGPHSAFGIKLVQEVARAFLIDLTRAGVQATAVPLVTTSGRCTRRWRSWVGLRNRKGKKPYASAGLLERKVVLKCQY